VKMMNEGGRAGRMLDDSGPSFFSISLKLPSSASVRQSSSTWRQEVIRW